MIRPTLRTVLVSASWIAILASRAHAHGGIAGPDELGPPVIISTALGIGGYWTVMLWPSGRERNRRKTNKVRRLAR
jgi:hypothetical protein